MKIRYATMDDAQNIIEFNRAMAFETEALSLDLNVLSKGVTTLLNEPNKGCYLVADIDGDIAGSLMVTYEWSDWRAKNYYWIQSVYIRPEFRRQGIYKKLYQAVKQLAADNNGAASFRLYVEKDNVTAQQTYQSLGMKPCDYLMFEEK
ncbi:GNAT family N-acetyltransferase [Shewanella marina]|uniref:GNAT family N-acetyltransferase n=1 Tax=Shewanella marina TaxID=487319 RepID=UPI000470316A|nr:GNAT family N-acetyltransferase [Shewanella marina]